MKRPTIALIEDEPLLRVALARTLDDAGYEVLSAASGVEGLGLLEDRAIDLAIIDIRLPGRLDGVALVREALHARPDLRVIFTSGQPPSDDQLESFGSFLQKPYRVDALLTAVQRELTAPR